MGFLFLSYIRELSLCCSSHSSSSTQLQFSFSGTHISTGMDFSVIVKENEVVRASLPSEQQWLPLSNLDLLLPPLEFGVFLCYRKPPQCNGPWMSRTLKRSLAQTLVLFYPLSGEVVKSSAGEPVLLCNNRGVDFLEAFADVELREMDFYNTDATIEEKLMPKKKDAVLSILVRRPTAVLCFVTLCSSCVAFLSLNHLFKVNGPMWVLDNLAQIEDRSTVSRLIYCKTLWDHYKKLKCCLTDKSDGDWWAYLLLNCNF